MKRYFAIILFAAALASCTPKLYDAQVEVPENYRFAGDFPQDSVSLPFAWWEIFGDSTLNRLVEHALENNRNLAQAASRIFEARANIAVARAPFLPSVGLNLSALYNSWGLPLAILLSVPLAVLGALLFVGAAYLVSPEFINNIYMQISLVMLIGLSAKNAILVVEYADQLFFEKNMDLKAATIEAARLRMRPIMMTAFSFILGVMPLIFASGVYATARNIMGMALVGGMLLATMLGIFIYPALYYLVARVGKFEHKRELKQKES